MSQTQKRHGRDNSYGFVPIFKAILLSFGLLGSISLSEGAWPISSKAEASAFAASLTDGSASTCIHICTPVVPANRKLCFPSSGLINIQPALCNANNSWLLKSTASFKSQYVVMPNCCPENLFTAATIFCSSCGLSSLGALNLSNSSFASAARASAFAARSVALAIRSPDAFTSSLCNLTTTVVAIPTRAAANAAIPRDTSIAVSHQCKSNPNIRLSLLESVVFIVCGLSMLVLLGCIVFVIVDYFKTRYG